MNPKEATSEEKKEEQFLYVLEARPGTLRNSANYLKNRGWKIHSTTKVKDFLALVMGSQPQLVMICIDHPNPSAGNLSKLIDSAFPNTRVIAFVDGASSASLAKLKNSKHEYSVYPPLSGPAIERVILRVQKDLQRASESPTTSDPNALATEGDKSGGADAVVIKGRGNAGGSAAEQARNMLAQFMASDDPHDAGSTNGFATGNGAFGSGASHAQMNSGAPHAQVNSSASGSALRSSAMMGGRRMFPRRQRTPDGSSMSGGSGSPGSTPKMDFSPSGGWSLREFDPNSPQGYDPHDALGDSGYASRSPNAPLLEYEEGSRRTKGLPKFTQADASLIIKATDTALDETVIKGKATQTTERISTTTSVACIAIESLKFTGYLVAALGKNRKIDDKFIKDIRSRLVEFMRNAGEDFSADDALDLNLHQVEFEGWALKQAEFLRKTIHNGQEIAMAFFPEKINSVPLEISASKNMLKLDIHELVGNATMEFDLYVHLPANNKYVLYTRQDQTLHADQLDRLKTKGVQSMHLRKEDETNVRRYRVRNFLNDKIKEHLDDGDFNGAPEKAA